MSKKIIIWNAADGTQQETTLDDINTCFNMTNAVDIVTGANNKQFYLFDDNPLDVVEYDSNDNVKRFVVITDIKTSDIKDIKKRLHKINNLTDFDNYEEIIYKN